MYFNEIPGWITTVAQPGKEYLRMHPRFPSHLYFPVSFVAVSSAGIFVSVLDRGDSENENDGTESEVWIDRVHLRDKVDDSDVDKVDIGEAVKLLEKVLWDEVPVRVLRRLHLIRGQLALAFGERLYPVRR